MPRVIDAGSGGAIDLDTLVAALDAEPGDLAEEERLATFGPLLAQLGRNRDFLPALAIEALKTQHRQDSFIGGYGAQVLMLRPATARYVLRANFWPAADDAVMRHQRQPVRLRLGQRRIGDHRADGGCGAPPALDAKRRVAGRRRGRPAEAAELRPDLEGGGPEMRPLAHERRTDRVDGDDGGDAIGGRGIGNGGDSGPDQRSIGARRSSAVASRSGALAKQRRR